MVRVCGKRGLSLISFAALALAQIEALGGIQRKIGELGLLHLVGRGDRQLGKECDVTWCLEVGEALEAPVLDGDGGLPGRRGPR